MSKSLTWQQQIEVHFSQAFALKTLSILNSAHSAPQFSDLNIDSATLLSMYKNMLFIRCFDERLLAAQRQGRISFYMTCLGEEAAVTASAAAMQAQDMIFAQYREQAALSYRGFSIDDFMQQLFSTDQDLGKGRQMPIHYGSRELHYMTISSPLGTQIPQAPGYAYGQKMSGSANTSLCYFAEGAASEGDFHAGLNIAAVLKVPMVFFCRNNGYAISTPSSEQYAGAGIAERGIGYGMPCIRVDGNDLLAVYLVTRRAREMAFAKQTPVLIEAMTFRLGAHSTSDDPAGYRSQQEEQKWQTHCPIKRVRDVVYQQCDFNSEQEADYLAQVKTQIVNAMAKAELKAKPPLRTLIEDVYQQVPVELQRQFDQLPLEQYCHAEDDHG